MRAPAKDIKGWTGVLILATETPCRAFSLGKNSFSLYCACQGLWSSKLYICYYDLILMEFECYLGGRGHSSIPFHYSIPLILDSLLSLSPCSAILSVWLHHLAMLLSAWVCVCVWVCGGRGVFVFLCVYLCVFVCVCVCQLF